MKEENLVQVKILDTFLSYDQVLRKVGHEPCLVREMDYNPKLMEATEPATKSRLKSKFEREEKLRKEQNEQQAQQFQSLAPLNEEMSQMKRENMELKKSLSSIQDTLKEMTKNNPKTQSPSKTKTKSKVKQKSTDEEEHKGELDLDDLINQEVESD